METLKFMTRLTTTSLRVTLMIFSLFTVTALASTTSSPLEVEIEHVTDSTQLKTREFVGSVNIGGLIDVSAPVSGVLTEFMDAPGAEVNARQRLAAIKNLDELYKDVVIKAPLDDVRIIRTFVEEGNFVERHQRLMVLAREVYYEANINLVASEVEWLNQARDIHVLVHPNTKHETRFAISESRIEIPEQHGRFYNARLRLSCDQIQCEATALAGAIVKVLVTNVGDIHISKEALLDNGKNVAVVNDEGRIERRQIIKGKETDSRIEVLHGLTVNDRLVVRFNRPPLDGEAAHITSSLAQGFGSDETIVAYE